jgi:hypothetical protein
MNKVLILLLVILATVKCESACVSCAISQLAPVDKCENTVCATGMTCEYKSDDCTICPVAVCVADIGGDNVKPCVGESYIHHIVLFKFEEAGGRKFDAITEEVKKLADISGVVSATGGETFKHEKAQGYSYGISLYFNTMEDLKAYGDDPKHGKYINPSKQLEDFKTFTKSYYPDPVTDKVVKFDYVKCGKVPDVEPSVGNIHHIVLFKFRETEGAKFDDLTKEVETLADISGVSSATGGETFELVKNQGYTYGISLYFNTMEDLKAYGDDPKHGK